MALELTTAPFQVSPVGTEAHRRGKGWPQVPRLVKVPLFPSSWPRLSAALRCWPAERGVALPVTDLPPASSPPPRVVLAHRGEGTLLWSNLAWPVLGPSRDHGPCSWGLEWKGAGGDAEPTATALGAGAWLGRRERGRRASRQAGAECEPAVHLLQACQPHLPRPEGHVHGAGVPASLRLQ